MLATNHAEPLWNAKNAGYNTGPKGNRALDERLSQASERRLEAKEHVFCEGDARSHVYLVEDGVWTLTSGRTKVSARYDLRWRRIEGRWRVSFLRWELFK